MVPIIIIEVKVLRTADCSEEPGKPTPIVKMIAVYIPTAAHFVLDQTARAANTAIPSKIGEKRWPVVPIRVPSPKLAASAKQATRRIRDGREHFCSCGKYNSPNGC